MPQAYSHSFKRDADNLLKDELILTKIEVAKRQLVTAIKMFFFDWDAVSTHTVVAAAHGVVRDTARCRGITKSFKDSPLIAPEARRDYLRTVNYPQNFFKHAKDDPDGKMVFRYHGTSIYLLDALLLYVALHGEITYEMRVFFVWAQLRFPDLLCLEQAELDLKQVRDTTRDPKAFKLLGKVLLTKFDQKQDRPSA